MQFHANNFEEENRIPAGVESGLGGGKARQDTLLLTLKDRVSVHALTHSLVPSTHTQHKVSPKVFMGANHNP